MEHIELDLNDSIIIDNSPVSYELNPENAIPIDNWMGTNFNDECLLDIIPLLESLRDLKDVRSILGRRDKNKTS